MEGQCADYKSLTGATTNNKSCRVDCEICSASLAAGSYPSHLESLHNVFQSMVFRQEIVVDCPPVIYHVLNCLLRAGTSAWYHAALARQAPSEI